MGDIHFKMNTWKVIYVLGSYMCLQVRGTIKEPQLYGLGMGAPKSYHSVLLFN